MEKKKLILTVLLVVAIGLAAIFFIRHTINIAAEKDLAIAIQGERMDFLGKSVWMRSTPNKTQYTEEVSALLKSYFQHIKYLYEKYEKPIDLDARWTEHERGGAAAGTPIAPGISARRQESATYKEAFDYSKKIYRMLETGIYDPVYTDTKEAARLDFYNVEKVDGKGGSFTRWSFLLWGPFPEMRYSGMELKLYDASGKLYGSINSASSQPNLRVDDPSMWIPSFPPGVIPGYYELPLIPDPVVTMDLLISMSGKTYFGSSVSWTWEYKGLQVPALWKLPLGAKWDAKPVEVEQPQK
jgi:predicted small secreted protein